MIALFFFVPSFNLGNVRWTFCRRSPPLLYLKHSWYLQERGHCVSNSRPKQKNSVLPLASVSSDSLTKPSYRVCTLPPTSLFYHQITTLVPSSYAKRCCAVFQSCSVTKFEAVLTLSAAAPLEISFLVPTC